VDEPKNEGIQLSIRPQFAKDASDIQFVNYFRFSCAGTDVVMDLGVLDPATVASLLAQPTLTPEADATIVKRYGMSLNGLALLRRQVDDICAKIDTSKVLDPHLTKR
jgi:hypothetical protein